MGGAAITLEHMVANAIHQDLLAQAARQRTAAGASQPRPAPFGESDIRAVVAAALLRAGSWLMPEATPEQCASPG